jgi:hypothetical protein
VANALVAGELPPTTQQQQSLLHDDEISTILTANETRISDQQQEIETLREHVRRLSTSAALVTPSSIGDNAIGSTPSTSPRPLYSNRPSSAATMSAHARTSSISSTASAPVPNNNNEAASSMFASSIPLLDTGGIGLAASIWRANHSSSTLPPQSEPLSVRSHSSLGPQPLYQYLDDIDPNALSARSTSRTGGS